MTLSLAFLTPDFLVVDVVPPNWSPRAKFPANREKNREKRDLGPVSIERSPNKLDRSATYRSNSLRDGTGNQIRRAGKELSGGDANRESY
jgi:hypothetical protein